MKRNYLLPFSLVCGFGVSALYSPLVHAEPNDTKAKISEENAKLGYERAEEKIEEGKLEELAKNTGFVKYLPKESEAYFSYLGVEEMVEKLRNTQVGKFFETLVTDTAGEEGEDLFSDPFYRQIMDIAGEELFVSTGKGSASMLETLMVASNEVNKIQYALLFETLLSEFDPELLGVENPEAMTADMLAFAKKEDGLLKLIKELEIAPIYAGFKVSDDAKREEYVTMIMDTLNEFIESNDDRVMKSVDSKVGDGFFGFEVTGQGFLDMQATEDPGSLETMELLLGKDLADQMKAEIGKRRVSVLVGSIDDYVVFYAGKDVESLQLMDSVEDSLLNNPEMSFVKKHAGDELAVLGYMSEVTAKALKKHNVVLKVYADSLSQVLDKTEIFGDTTKFQALLKSVGEAEGDLYGMMPAQRTGIVASVDNGFKIDMYLGQSYPSLDLDTPRNLLTMVNDPDAVLYGNWIITDEYNDKSNHYLKTIGELAYEGMKLASKLENDDPDWVQFRSYFNLFDQQFSGHALDLLATLNGEFTDGLGAEFGMMLDLKGALPRIPQVPSVVLENMEIPRLTVVKPVKEREKLSIAWDKINATAHQVSNQVGAMINQETPLPKPEKATRYGLDTWSYQLGVTTKEANLAVALNDELWFMTTAPAGLENFKNRVESKNGRQSKPGAEFVIRFAPIREAVRKGVAFFEQHGKELNEGGYEEFLEEKPLIEGFLNAFEEFDLIDFYTRKEGGEVQSTIHFKMN